MGTSFLSFTVEVLDDLHHGSHRVADFARLTPAIRAAHHALNDPRVSLAVVRGRDGELVYACDRDGNHWMPEPADLSGCPRCGGQVVQGRTPDERFCEDCGLNLAVDGIAALRGVVEEQS